jgi:hypothetical protein
MEHYVTIFDSLFLPQGMALHRSMERHAADYTLWILCVDDKAYEVLQKLDLPNSRLLQATQLETEELKRAKLTRSIGEYCWTLTPFAPRFVFDADETVQRVTYIDADLWFRKNPGLIFEEFEAAGKHVLITDHAYAPEYDQSATSGQYCVQFITFTRTGGESVRKWWEERCIEWCHAWFEDGKFGDQKYLDDWPERFPGHVHVLANKELAQAPWNAERFPHGNAVFWHFHGLRIKRGMTRRLKVHIGRYRIPGTTIKNVYVPYLADLRVSADRLNGVGYAVREQKKYTPVADAAWYLKQVFNRLSRHIFQYGSRL